MISLNSLSYTSPDARTFRAFAGGATFDTTKGPCLRIPGLTSGDSPEVLPTPRIGKVPPRLAVGLDGDGITGLIDTLGGKLMGSRGEPRMEEPVMRPRLTTGPDEPRLKP
jgi:hypothetical protein